MEAPGMNDLVGKLIGCWRDTMRLSALVGEERTRVPQVVTGSASPADITRLEHAWKVQLPPSYRAFLEVADGLELKEQPIARLGSISMLLGEEHQRTLERFHVQDPDLVLPGPLLGWNPYSLAFVALDLKRKPRTNQEPGVVFRAGDGTQHHFGSFQEFVEDWVRELEKEKKSLVREAGLKPDELKRILGAPNTVQETSLDPELLSPDELLHTGAALMRQHKRPAKDVHKVEMLSKFDLLINGEGLDGFLSEHGTAEVKTCCEALETVGAGTLAKRLAAILELLPAGKASRAEALAHGGNAALSKRIRAFEDTYDEASSALIDKVARFVIHQIGQASPEVGGRAKSVGGPKGRLARVAQERGMAGVAKAAGEFVRDLRGRPSAVQQRILLVHSVLACAIPEGLLSYFFHSGWTKRWKSAVKALEELDLGTAADVLAKAGSHWLSAHVNGRVPINAEFEPIIPAKVRRGMAELDKRLKNERRRIIDAVARYAMENEAAVFRK